MSSNLTWKDIFDFCLTLATTSSIRSTIVKKSSFFKFQTPLKSAIIVRISWNSTNRFILVKFEEKKLFGSLLILPRCHINLEPDSKSIKVHFCNFPTFQYFILLEITIETTPKRTKHKATKFLKPNQVVWFNLNVFWWSWATLKTAY